MATLTKQTLHPTRIDIPESERYKLVELLNQTLAATMDLYSQIKQAHWNVKGKDFFQLHELFDQIAMEVQPFIDMVAERATTLGGTAMGTTRLAAKNSVLAEYPHDIYSGLDHIHALIERLAAYGSHVREGIDTADSLNDKDTADLYTEISRAIDTRLWFLEAHIQA